MLSKLAFYKFHPQFLKHYLSQIVIKLGRPSQVDHFRESMVDRNIIFPEQRLFKLFFLHSPTCFALLFSFHHFPLLLMINRNIFKNVHSELSSLMGVRQNDSIELMKIETLPVTILSLFSLVIRRSEQSVTNTLSEITCLVGIPADSQSLRALT